MIYPCSLIPYPLPCRLLCFLVLLGVGTESSGNVVSSLDIGSSAIGNFKRRCLPQFPEGLSPARLLFNPSHRPLLYAPEGLPDPKQSQQPTLNPKPCLPVPWSVGTLLHDQLTDFSDQPAFERQHYQRVCNDYIYS